MNMQRKQADSASAAMGGRLNTQQVGTCIYAVIAGLAVLVIIFPFLWIMLNSIRGIENFLSLELSDYLPRRLDFTSYRMALERSDLFRWMGNSFFVAVLATTISLLVSAPAAFALTRLQFR